MIGTIDEELALCRAAFADSQMEDFAWNIHHNELCELLTEPAESRIQYILREKPKHEQACRFHNMRPVRGKLPEQWHAACVQWDTACKQWDTAREQWDTAYKQWDAAYKQRDAAYKQWDAAREQWDTAYKQRDDEWDAAYKQWDTAREQWDAAREQWDTACKQWDAACGQWDATCKKYRPVLEALHVAECPDSTWDSESIF